jgi:hypothetical protein
MDTEPTDSGPADEDLLRRLSSDPAEQQAIHGTQEAARGTLIPRSRTHAAFMSYK